MKRLYLVTLTYNMYVMGEDADEALEEAAQHTRDAGPDDGETDLVKAFSRVRSEWSNAVPYNTDDDDERTVSEIVKEMKQNA